MGFTEKRWREHVLLLFLFIGLVFLSFLFLQKKSGLTAEERTAYSIANTSYKDDDSYLSPAIRTKIFSDTALPSFAKNYDIFTKTFFSFKHIKNFNISNTNSWKNSSYFTNFLLADAEHNFDYLSVIENCNINGTAPLYYLMLHTLSSMFPYYTIKYVGFTLNLLIVLAIFFIIFYICKKHLASIPARIASCILFCFSLGAISSILCTQNYLLTTLFILLSFAFHLNCILDERDRVWNLRFLSIVTILGILTDYEFLAFSCILNILFILCMLCFNEFKIIFKYCMSMFFSVIIVILLYPAIVSHLLLYFQNILFSMHQKKHLSILISYWTALQDYLLIRGNLCFAFLFLLTIICILALLLNPFPFHSHLSNFRERITNMEIADIFLFTFFFLSIGSFILFEITCSLKLFLGFLPFAAILICYLMYRLCHSFMKSDFYIGSFIATVVSIVCFLSLFTNNPDYLQKENKETISLANTYVNTPCIFVNNNDTDVYNYILELGIHKKTMPIHTKDIKTLKKDNIVKTSRQLILYLDNQPSSDSILAKFLTYGKYNFSKCLCNTNNTLGTMQVYLLYR